MFIKKGPMTALNYQEWFHELTGLDQPHPWQNKLADGDAPANRLIRIPTGLGKTAGVVIA